MSAIREMMVAEEGHSKTPKWFDACEHGPGTFVASFEMLTLKGKKVYDLYVFENGRPEDRYQEVCIRYGEEGSQYISPGSIGEFFSRANGDPICTRARELLFELGKATWVRNQPPS